MRKKQFMAGLYGLSLVISWVPVDAGVSSGPSEPQGDWVRREEFAALSSRVDEVNSRVEKVKSEVEALNLNIEKLHSKMDSILHLLANDGPFAEIFRGPQGRPGIQGPPGPVANSTEILARLDDLEKFRQKVEPFDIYFGTQGGGLKVYSEATNQVDTFVASAEDIEGLAWDDSNQHLYFCSQSKIFRANREGTDLQTLFSSTNYGELFGLALDWITSNLYVAGRGGYVLVCRTGTTTGQLECKTVLRGQGLIHGITLDPNSGTMYFAKASYSVGGIIKSQMDGSNIVQIIAGLTYPAGLTIDFDSRRLFWADWVTHRIQSSHLDGTGVQLVAQLPAGTRPWGIVTNNDRLFWGNWGSMSLQNSRKSGKNVRTLYTGKHNVQHLIRATFSPVQTRVNHCEEQSCSGIFVLNRNSFRCLVQ